MEKTETKKGNTDLKRRLGLPISTMDVCRNNFRSDIIREMVAELELAQTITEVNEILSSYFIKG